MHFPLFDILTEELFYEASYVLGRDFVLEVSDFNWEYNALKKGNGNIIQYVVEKFGDIYVNNIHGYASGLCYYATPNFAVRPSEILGYALKMSHNLDKADIPEQVDIAITSESNVFGISRAVWVEGTPFDLSFSLKTPTLYLLTIMPYQYELLGMDHILVTIEKSD